MAKTTYISVTAGLEDSYKKGLRSVNRFLHARMGLKNGLLSRQRKKNLEARSYLAEFSALWQALSGAEKTAWINAGGECGLGGFFLFVQDTSARRLAGLAGVATPSLFHQSRVGHIEIAAPATEIKLIQEHPHFYYNYGKVAGMQSARIPAGVTENIVLPFTLGLNYKSNLTSQGAGASAKLYARFWYGADGLNQYQNLEISLDLVANWKTDSVVLSTLPGYLVGYDLYFHLYNLRGDLYFDNIKAEHGGINYARDQFCEDIAHEFGGAFYQILPYWTPAVALASGATFESTYKDF